MARKYANTKYDPVTYPVRLYQFIRDNSGAYEGAWDYLGITKNLFHRWRKLHPEFEHALKQAVEDTAPVETTFAERVMGRLSLKAKRHWQRICRDGIVAGIDSDITVPSSEDVLVKQEVFFKALLGTGFNVSHACHVAGVSILILRNHWLKDHEFKALFDEIDTMRGDFYESALMKLVEKGDTQAIIFVNKTFNKDRGYHEKVKIEFSRSQEDQTLEREKLSLETRRRILEELKFADGKQPEPIPVEALPSPEPTEAA